MNIVQATQSPFLPKQYLHVTISNPELLSNPFETFFFKNDIQDNITGGG
jgi:hypothetical protein